MPDAAKDLIQEIKSILGPEILEKSGAVFYSPPQNVDENNGIYFIGYNPGGDEEKDDYPSIEKNLEVWTSLSPDINREEYILSEYGNKDYQEAIEKIFNALNQELALTNCSNWIFVRSRQENDSRINENIKNKCYKAQKAIIDFLKPSVIISFSAHVYDRHFKLLPDFRYLDKTIKIPESNLPICYGISKDERKIIAYFPHMASRGNAYSQNSKIYEVLEKELREKIQNALDLRKNGVPIWDLS